MHAADGFFEQSPIDFDFFGYTMCIPSTHPLKKMFTLESNDYQPYRESGLIAVCDALRKVGSRETIVDIGANVGDSLAIMARKSDCNMLCVEASDFFFSYLAENVRRNFNNRASIMHALVAGSSDNQHKGLFHWGGTARQSDLPFTESCQIVSLIDILNVADPVALLKLDIDGEDVHLLQEAITLSLDNDIWANWSFPIYFEFEFKNLEPETARSDAKRLVALMKQFKRAGYTDVFMWDAVGRLHSFTKLEDFRSIYNAINYMYHPEHQCVWGYDILVLHSANDKLKTALDCSLNSKLIMRDFEAQIVEDFHREDAVRFVLDSTLASRRWWGLDRKHFKSLITAEAKRTPNTGPKAVKHAVLHAETQKVLGLKT